MVHFSIEAYIVYQADALSVINVACRDKETW